jgi:hypothetical protein
MRAIKLGLLVVMALGIGLLPVVWLSIPRRTVKAQEVKVVHIQEINIAAKCNVCACLYACARTVHGDGRPGRLYHVVQ